MEHNLNASNRYSRIFRLMEKRSSRRDFQTLNHDLTHELVIHLSGIQGFNEEDMQTGTGFVAILLDLGDHSEEGKMKKILILTMVLVVVLSFSATKAEAADYGTWLYLKYVLSLDNADPHQSLASGAASSVAGTTTVDADKVKSKVIDHRDGEGLVKNAGKMKDRPAVSKEWRLNPR
ncbi:MAG: hypothetical protein V2A56_05105 [bacterium]